MVKAKAPAATAMGLFSTLSTIVALTATTMSAKARRGTATNVRFDTNTLPCGIDGRSS